MANPKGLQDMWLVWCVENAAGQTFYNLLQHDASHKSAQVLGLAGGETWGHLLAESCQMTGGKNGDSQSTCELCSGSLPQMILQMTVVRCRLGNLVLIMVVISYITSGSRHTLIPEMPQLGRQSVSQSPLPEMKQTPHTTINCIKCSVFR